MTGQTSVKSTLRYTRDTGTAPEVYFYEPPAGTKWRESGDDPREMIMHDGWDRAASFSLDREGFALREFHSSFDHWDDDAAIRAQFYGQVADFIKQQVGAERVVIFDHTIRAQEQRRPDPRRELHLAPRAGDEHPLRLHREFGAAARAPALPRRGGRAAEASRRVLQFLEAAAAHGRGAAAGDVRRHHLGRTPISSP